MKGRPLSSILRKDLTRSADRLLSILTLYPLRSQRFCRPDGRQSAFPAMIA